MQKSRIKGYTYRGAQIAFGSFGLKCLEPKFITSRQIEAARIAITRYMKREGQLWIRIFPDKPITKKPAEVRMGKGKGSPEYWVAVCEPGRIIFEIEGVSEEVAKEAMRLGAQKLPGLMKFITRHDLRGRINRTAMKQKEIIELTDKQLKEMLADERLSYTKMRLSHSISSHENPMKLKETKKKIARILTEQKARLINKSAAETANK